MKEKIIDLITIPILILLFVPLLTNAIKVKTEPVDICKTPIYKLTVSELNEAVIVCKANKAEIRSK